MNYTITNLKQIIGDSMKLPSETYVYRENHMDWLYKSLDNNLIKAITGFRRVGKSMLLKRLTQHLLTNLGVDLNNIFYINFEHDELIGLKTADDLRSLYELFLKHASNANPIYLFLDEIQNVKGWERFVRTLHESEKDGCKIFITGSNSTILSGELASTLGGRVLERNVKPFNFREFLKYKGSEVRDLNDLITNKTFLEQNFTQYLYRGGMPESINLDQNMAKDYLQAVFQKVVVEDISKRTSVRRVLPLQDLFKYTISNVGKITNARSLQKEMKLAGEDITSPTISKYLNLYQKSYATREISKFNWKLNKIFEKSRKIYIVDNSFLTAFSLNKLELDGQLLENLVFNELDHDENQIYYGQDDKNKEVDFVIKKQNDYYKYQATVALTAQSSGREFGNFELIGNYCGKGNNYLITLNGELKTHNHQDLLVHEIPAINFALGKDFYLPYL